MMLCVGATVTSRDAGLSIPDPVSNHGSVIPMEQLQNGYESASGRRYSGGDVFSEFFHRAVGWTLGSLSIALAVFVWKAERDARLRKLAAGALGVVVLQGAVGALGVWMKQPAAMVVPHAFLAQAFLALVVAVAYFTSAEGRELNITKTAAADGVLRGSFLLAILAFIQIVLGAFYRHANDLWAIAGHVAGALIFVAIAAWVTTVAQPLDGRARRLTRHATALGAIVMLQIFLGFLALLFRKPKNEAVERGLLNILFPTIHVVTGVVITAGSVLLALRARQLLQWTRSGERAESRMSGASA